MKTLLRSPSPDDHTSRRRHRAAFATAVLWLLPILASAPAAPAETAESVPLPTWKRLEMSASKLLLTAHSAVEVGATPAREARTRWIEIDEPRECSQTLIHLRSEASLLGRRSTNDVWIEADDLAAHQRSLLELGSRARTKTYRYGRAQVLAVRSEPADSSEQDLPPGEWTRRSRQQIPVQSGAVTDPLSIIYLVTTAPGDELRAGVELEILSSNQVDKVRVQRQDGIELLETNASIQTINGDSLREGRSTVPVILYSVTPISDGGDFSLLGLDGAVEIAVDHRYGVPLEIRGRISPVGRIAIRLEKAVLRQRP